jgi:phosphoribosylglycinamide formyltransferase-1
VKLAVLASGAGTNLQALLDAAAAGTLRPAEIALVLSNRPDAGALARARAAGVEAVVVDHTGYSDRTSFERAMLDELAAREIGGVVLAGFMRVLTETFIDAFPRRIINTHPSLLPAFPGVAAPRQAIEHGVKVAGCTVHFVELGVDSGPIIAQRAIDVLPDDTPESLHARIQELEHALLPEVTSLLAAGRLVCDGRRVRVAGN